MNLFYLTKALTTEQFLDASFDPAKNTLYLMTAFPGWPLKEIMEITQAAVDIAILQGKERNTLNCLNDVLNTERNDFAKRSVIADTLLWSSAYLRAGAPVISAFNHWRDHPLFVLSKRDSERYKSYNGYLFEYCYRLMAKFRGMPPKKVEGEGFISKYIEAHRHLPLQEIYEGLNRNAGFKTAHSTASSDNVFTSVIKELGNGSGGAV